MLVDYREEPECVTSKASLADTAGSVTSKSSTTTHSS